MLHWYRELVELLTPRQATEDETDRARFLVQVFLVVCLVCLAYVPLNLYSGMWGQLGLTVVVLVCSAVLLLLLWRGVRLRVAMHLSLGVMTVAFAASTLMQQPFDPTNLIALALVPVMASYLLGRDSGWWLPVAMAMGAGAYLAGRAGIAVPVVDANPSVSALFNLCFGILVAWIFTRRFDALRSRSLERMKEADRAKNVFLATVGHEIRTPMNGVLGMTEVMLQEPLSEKQRERLEVIQRSGQQMVALINDLLDVTKLEAGKLTVDVKAFDLYATLRDVEALARPQAEARGLRLVVEREASVPRWVLGDAMRLAQVLNNLLSNAIKFTPSGEVGLRTAVRGRKLVLTVHDSGPGIPREDQERVFLPFEQLESGARRRHSGTGLGLAISKQLVTLMGGALSLDSASGRGTRLEVTLPLIPASGPAATATSSPKPGGASGGPGRVLVVDDNPINLKVATALVEKAGFTALAASSGPQALALMEQEQVSLVLMDCHMPDMDGFETTERIRARENGAHLPIVALTASAGPDDVAACKRAGMDECLAKPVRFDALREVLQRFSGEAVTPPS
jgi:signal transduction histidine kinase/CheY-like chemotaxis protein